MYSDYCVDLEWKELIDGTLSSRHSEIDNH